MSDEWDDDVWDPIIEVVEENKLVEISIDAVTKEQLEQVLVEAKKALIEKLKKLNVVLKNLDVYCHNGRLLVNDRYGICKEITEIATAFGFSVELVNCGLKGKSYILHDKLFDLIKVLDSTFDIGNFSNKTTNYDLQDILAKKNILLPVGTELQDILRTILREGKLFIMGSQKITTTYEDGRQISQQKGEIVSDKDLITSQLHSYMTATQEKLVNANSDLQNGTVKLLYHRARQMGYSVKEERKGTQVQLVLVRAE